MSFNLVPVLEVLQHVLEALELRLQLLLLGGQRVQLLPEPRQERLEHGLQAPARGPLAPLLLQQLPLGLQDAVLLLQEPDLDGGGDGKSQVLSKGLSCGFFAIVFPTWWV